MDKDSIIQQEKANDGQTILLFYDSMAGVYLAFGLSAYYTTMVTEPFMSFSEEVDMPVAMLRKEHVLLLRQSIKKVDHAKKAFYHFKMKTTVGNAGYERWANVIKDRHNNVRT